MGGHGGTLAEGRGDSGFTLLEMIVVVAIMGLVLGLVLQRGPSRSDVLDLRAAAEEVSRTLRLARTRAITTDRTVVFRLDARGHAFAADGGPSRMLPASMAIDVLAAASSGGGGVAAIGFAPDGSSSGGRIALAEGARRIDIGVDWLTGRVILGALSTADAR